VLVLQALYTLSDEQAEYQVRDRLSFMRLAGLARHDAVPDAKTIWLCREQLTRAGALARLFACLDPMLAERSNLLTGGQIVDATLVEARRRCATAARQRVGRRRARDRSTATGAGPSSAAARRRRPRARSTRPRPRSRCRCSAGPKVTGGHKNHLGIDRAHGFISRFTVTHAARHHGSQLGAVLDPNNTASGVRVGDRRLAEGHTAYRTKPNLDALERRGLVPEFRRAKPRGRSMPAHIARGNATRARVRSLVKHVFAAEKRRMGLVVRSIGPVRATARITLANLAYNMRRPVWIEGRGALA